MIEITVFSHIQGKVEVIKCSEINMRSNGNVAYIDAELESGDIKMIPWNRVKEVFISKEKIGDDGNETNKN